VSRFMDAMQRALKQMQDTGSLKTVPSSVNKISTSVSGVPSMITSTPASIPPYSSPSIQQSAIKVLQVRQNHDDAMEVEKASPVVFPAVELKVSGERKVQTYGESVTDSNDVFDSKVLPVSDVQPEKQRHETLLGHPSEQEKVKSVEAQESENAILTSTAKSTTITPPSPLLSSLGTTLSHDDAENVQEIIRLITRYLYTGFTSSEEALLIQLARAKESQMMDSFKDAAKRDAPLAELSDALSTIVKGHVSVNQEFIKKVKYGSKLIKKEQREKKEFYTRLVAKIESPRTIVENPVVSGLTLNRWLSSNEEGGAGSASEQISKPRKERRKLKGGFIDGASDVSNDLEFASNC
jgi:hypothetical protein